MISCTDAPAYPGTMMVEHQDALGTEKQVSTLHNDKTKKTTAYGCAHPTMMRAHRLHESLPAAVSVLGREQWVRRRAARKGGRRQAVVLRSLPLPLTLAGPLRRCRALRRSLWRERRELRIREDVALGGVRRSPRGAKRRESEADGRNGVHRAHIRASDSISSRVSVAEADALGLRMRMPSVAPT